MNASSPSSVMTHSVSVSTEQNPIFSISNFTIEKGHLTFLFGESGIGKTLLCKTLFGLLDPDDLHIQWNHQDYQHYLNSDELKQLRRVGYFVFQEPSSHLNQLQTIEEQLNEGDLSGIDHSDILASLFPAYPEDLLPVYPKPYRPSGGEKQRFLLAMALKKMDKIIQENISDSPLFIFDEPTGSLDNAWRNQFIQQLVNRLKKHSFTIIMITHDYSIISEMDRKYSEFLHQISYREIVRKNLHELDMLTFDAKRYLDWIDKKKSELKKKKSLKSKNSPIVSLASGVTIFGRELQFFQDKHHEIPLDHISIYSGEMVYMKAPSGVGKTTIGKIISGIFPADHFHISFDQLLLNDPPTWQEWKEKIWGKKVSMVFQHADEALNAQSSVKEIFYGLPIPESEKESRIQDGLKLFFADKLTPEFLDKKVKNLSGGQKQRLNVLRSLLTGANLIILDEPLNGLDFTSIQAILNVIESQQKNGISFLLISHNEDIFDALIPESSIVYLRAELI